ncbi:hypothetical protein BWI96_06060 [Siphonobacter sp. SORGH_AS_0500]|nr:hypothetical protein BWI96_06060 [Siphonobacter sp. SORGH_AS_0500]
MIKKQKLSLKQACLHFHLSSESLIVTWQKRFNESGLAGLQPRKKGRALMKKSEHEPNKRKPKSAKEPLSREEELLKENEYLRAENALLKKLHALVKADQKRK